jgi:hypothetical protein
MQIVVNVLLQLQLRDEHAVPRRANNANNRPAHPDSAFCAYRARSGTCPTRCRSSLLKWSIGGGLRGDEAQDTFGQTGRLSEALRKRGIPEAPLEEAARETAGTAH